MNDDALLEEAEKCRWRALAYAGQPEASFLLRAAREFEDLATKRKLAPVKRD